MVRPNLTQRLGPLKIVDAPLPRGLTAKPAPRAVCGPAPGLVAPSVARALLPAFALGGSPLS